MKKRARAGSILGVVFVFALIVCIQVIGTKADIKNNTKGKPSQAVAKMSVNATRGTVSNAIQAIPSSRIPSGNADVGYAGVHKAGIPSSQSKAVASLTSISSMKTSANENAYTGASAAAGSARSKNSRSVSANASNGIENANKDKVYYKHKIVVLTYHHISNQNFSGITIKPERFESDLKMLREKGFNVISFNEMLQAMDGNARVPDNAVVITFDDGINSLYNYAFPLLKKYNMPATSFLITSRNEIYSSFKNEDRPLSPDEIIEMYESGIIDFQSHTHQSHEKVYINSNLKKGAKLTNHIYDKVHGTYETDAEYEKRIIDDLNHSSDVILKYTGKRPTVLCFPFGIYNKQVIELAQQCGFKYFVTTQHGVNLENSTNSKILRIRAGDADMNTKELYNNILGAAK